MSYVLITPAHNESEHLERTIRAVIAQTIPPLRWVIVDDGSTDGTSDIAAYYAKKWPFIHVVRLQREPGRGFNKKAQAFDRGVREIHGLNYGFIGNLDADITVGPDYFENLIGEFEADRNLGITGGPIHTKIGDRFISDDTTLDSVAGAVQLFSKECFSDIGGGYLALPYGGIDAAAEIIAKMKGWSVRKSVRNCAFEHRQTGTATATPIGACFRLGRRFHSLGYGALFFSLRCIYRISDRPFVVGSCAQLCGFMMAAIKHQPIELPAEAVRFLREEQKRKLRQLFFRSGTQSNRPSTPQT